ncbi:hypothetical protein HK107_04630 [Parvularcula sp. ZS-1/3]|uniref:histidine kinase n=1 Tax=Parvularcula mediterranea TaxID=2732508 RepID=A0A7Y3RK89_9PROT|nr:ATP-binding protein [Parvularcula mediterranea]NNU15603.1 hypothetical protein [Parvularcula mediterranea]
MPAFLTNPDTLWRRYVVALGLIAVLLSISHGLSIYSIKAGEEQAALINMSGRQRMLQQRILSLVLRESRNGVSPAEAQALDEAVALFERSHNALSTGGDLGLSLEGAAERRTIYFSGSPSLDQEVKAFLDDVFAARQPLSRRRSAALGRLSNIERTDALLTRLDGVVRTLQSRADARVDQLALISNLTFALALLILAIEWMTIFRPAQRAVTSTLAAHRATEAKLKRADEELRRVLASEEASRAKVESLLRARTDLFANLGHDMRTPLTVLTGYLDLLMNQDLRPDQERLLGLARNASKQVAGLVDDILDLERLQEGMLTLSPVACDVRGFAERCADFFAAKAEAKGLELIARVDEEMPPQLFLDEGRLQQIANNLIGNAVKFTKGGQVTLSIGIESDGFFHVKVADTGPGITPEDARRLFERFEQSSPEVTSVHGGSGLGLAICRELSELMGGWMKLDSEVGEGSTFTLVLPLTPVPEEEAPRPETRQAAGG